MWEMIVGERYGVPRTRTMEVRATKVCDSCRACRCLCCGTGITLLLYEVEERC